MSRAPVIAKTCMELFPLLHGTLARKGELVLLIVPLKLKQVALIRQNSGLPKKSSMCGVCAYVPASRRGRMSEQTFGLQLSMLLCAQSLK